MVKCGKSGSDSHRRAARPASAPIPPQATRATAAGPGRRPPSGHIRSTATGGRARTASTWPPSR